MQTVQSGLVRGKDGWSGTVVPPAPPTPSDPAYICVQLDNAEQLLVPVAFVIPQEDGSYYVPLSLGELAPSPTEDRADTNNVLVIPVLEEEFEVEKRVVETGKVRVRKVVHTRQAVVDEPLMAETVEFERVPIQRVVDGPVPIRYEDDTTIIPILEEVLVVEKRLMLKEELHVHRRRRETHQPQQVTLRAEEVQIERLQNAAQENLEP